MLFCSVFPDGCTDFQGPHTVICKASVWLEGGCLERGQGFPGQKKGGNLESEMTIM